MTPEGSEFLGLRWEEGPWPLPPDYDDHPFDMANLRSKDTGVPGTVYVSTREGQHAPRVKWYPGRPAPDAPFVTVTLERPPRPINHGVRPWEAQDGVVSTVAWVEQNREALLRFWHEGAYWDRDEVNAFFDSLRKLP